MLEPKSPPAVMYPRNKKFVDDHQQEEKEVEYVHVHAVSEEEVIDPNCQEMKCRLGRVWSLQRLLERLLDGLALHASREGPGTAP